MPPLHQISRDNRDALQIVEAFSTAVAKAAIYSNRALDLAADYIESPYFDSEPETKEVIVAFTKFLRASKEDQS